MLRSNIPPSSFLRSACEGKQPRRTRGLCGGSLLGCALHRNRERRTVQSGAGCGHRVEAHDLLLRPPKGTALLFGGYTTHAGTPVECGERCVLVASFSRRGGKAKRRMEAEQSRDIYGDLL